MMNNVKEITDKDYDRPSIFRRFILLVKKLRGIKNE